MNYIDSTSEDYTSIMSDINNDPEMANIPDWLKRTVAGLGESLATLIYIAKNEAYLATAQTREAVKDKLSLLNYQLRPGTTSIGVCLFDLKPNSTFPVGVPAEQLKAQYKGLKFEARHAASIQQVSTLFNVVNGEIVPQEPLSLPYDGFKVQFTGPLPSPLKEKTDYYLIKRVNGLSVAATRADAYQRKAIPLAPTGTGTMEILSFPMSMYQQETREETLVGTVQGVEWEEVHLPERNILQETLKLRVGPEDYYGQQKVSIHSKGSDRHFVIIPKDAGGMAVRFGDGEYGTIPPKGHEVYVKYAVGGGSASNVTILGAISIYSGGNNNIAGVSNCTFFTGGNDEESLTSAKIKAPIVSEINDIFFYEEDGEELAIRYGGLSLCKVIGNAYGPLSCRVIGIANGGGSPALELRQKIQAYLQERTVFEDIKTIFEDCALTPFSLDLQLKLKPLYSLDPVEGKKSLKELLQLGLRLFFTETGKEIKDRYNERGIEDCISLMSTIFNVSIMGDRRNIQRMVENLEPRMFGETIALSDLYAYLQGSIEGIEYIELVSSTPALPYLLGQEEITTHNGLTISLVEVV